MFGLDLHSWENIMVGSLIVAGMIAVAVGVATLQVVRLQRAEIAASKSDFEKYKLDSERVTEALKRDANAAQLETEKLKSVVQWRTLSAEQNSAIEAILSQKPGAINLRWQDGDPEALFLAVQLSHLFEKSHWQVAPGSFKPGNGIIFEIIVPPASGANADTLRAALNAGRISYSAVPVPASGASFNVSTLNGAPFLYVGSRKPVIP